MPSRGSRVWSCPAILRPLSSVVNVHAKHRLGFFRGIHLVDLPGLRRIVIAPEPRELFRKLRVAVRGVVRTTAPTEMKIVLTHLERVRHLNILERPASVFVLQVFGAI